VGEYTADEIDCESSHGPAHASFEQDDEYFSALLTAQTAPQQWCGFTDMRYEGRLDGDSLSGSVPAFPSLPVTGALSMDGRELDLEIGAGRMRLHR